MDEPLGEAGIEGGEIDGFRPGGHGARVVVVHEDEVEVRAVAELDAAELSIGDDRVGSERGVSRHRRRPPVTGSDVAPCDRQRRAQHRFRDLREVVADDHQRDPARYVRRGHPQDVRLLRLAQAVHLVLAIRIVDSGEALGDVLVELVGRERLVEGARIEQLVEQDRVPAEQPRDPGARRAELHELRQCDGALREQREVDAAFRDRLDHRHHPLERRRRVALGRDGAQQIRGEAGQSLVSECIGHLERDGVPVPRDDRPCFACGGESRAFEQGHAGLFVGRAGEQSAEGIAPGGGIGLAFLAEHLRELLVHVAAMTVEPLGERFPARVAHAGRDPGAARLVQREHVLLPIVDLLQAMLDRAQKPIRGAQRLHRMGREQIELTEARKHRQEAPVAKRGGASAPYHLKRLPGELDLPDASGAVLHTVLHTLAGDLLLHHHLQRAQRLEGAEVDVTPVHERAQPLEQLRRPHHVAADRPGPNECVALPVAAVGLVVLLERVEAEHQRPLGSERTQPHVDAVDEAVRGRFAEHLHQLARELEEESIVVDAAPAALGLSVLGEGEDEVDVGGEVQLACAELAECKDDELLGLASVANGSSKIRALPLMEPIQAGVDDRIGQI